MRIRHNNKKEISNIILLFRFEPFFIFIILLVVLVSGIIILPKQGLAQNTVSITDLSSKLAAGKDHTAVIKEDGTLWEWGSNLEGQLGDGTTTDSATPIKVMNDVKSVAAGQYYTLAIKNDGTLWSWGYNGQGQLGYGSESWTPNPSPQQVMSNVKCVVAGEGHNLALKEDGSLWTWGYNEFGQLGNHDPWNHNSPTPVQIMSGVKSVAAGDTNSFAIKEDGSLWAWGDNLGYYLSVFDPVEIMSGVKSVSAGGFHNIILKEDGTLWAWGKNDNGQLGDGTTTDRLKPVQIISGVKSIVAGYCHTLAIKEDGTLWAWGDNNCGQLGDGTSMDSVTPIKVMSDVKNVAANGFHTIVIKEDGTLWAWGDNYAGQLGDGTTKDRVVHVQIPGFPCTILPLTINTISLPTGTVGSSYNATISASGGTSPYTWSVTELPSGLTLDSTTGVISGTPTSAIEASVKVTVTDSSGQSASVSLSLTINNGTTTPVVSNVQISPTEGYAGGTFTISANQKNNPSTVFLQFKNPGGGWISEEECQGKFALNQTSTNQDGSATYSITMPVIESGIEAEQYQRYFRVIAIDNAGNRNSDSTKEYYFVVMPNSIVAPTATGIPATLSLEKGKSVNLSGTVSCSSGLERVSVCVDGYTGGPSDNNDRYDTRPSTGIWSNQTSFDLNEFVIDSNSNAFPTAKDYTLKIWAKAVGATSATMVGSIKLSISAAKITLKSPSDGSNYTVGQPVDLSASGQGLSDVVFYVRKTVASDTDFDMVKGTDNGSGVYSGQWDSSGKVAGSYYVRAEANGETIQSDAVMIILDSQTAVNTFPEKENVPINKEWTVTLSQAIDPSSVNNSSVYVTDSSGKQVTAVLSVSSDGKTITIKPGSSGWNPMEQYTLHLTTSVKSKSGVALKQPVEMRFTTQLSDTNGTQGNFTIICNQTVFTGGSVTLTSDAPSNYDHVFYYLVDNGTGKQYGIGVSTDSSNKWKYVFDPIKYYDGRNYSMAIAARDKQGNLYYGKSIPNLVINITDRTKPTVSSTDPVDKAAEVALNKTITITFSENILPGDAYDCIRVNNLNINKHLTDNSNTLTLSHPSPMNANSSYNVTIPKGAVKDSAGNALANDYSFIFNTIDTIPPKMVNADPYQGEFVGTNDQIFIEFNEPINIRKPELIQAYNVDRENQLVSKLKLSLSNDRKALIISRFYGEMWENQNNYQIRIKLGAIEDDNSNINTSEMSFTINILDKPKAPATLTTTLNSLGVITLNWSKVNEAEKYYVYKSISPTGPFNDKDKIADTAKLTLDDNVLSIGKTYYYKVKAVNGAGISNNYSPMAEKSNSITLDVNTLNIKVGSSYTFTWQPNLSGIRPSDIGWFSTDDSVAYVKEGIVYGVTQGSAVITMSVLGYSAQCSVIVEKSDPSEVKRRILLVGNSVYSNPIDQKHGNLPGSLNNILLMEKIIQDKNSIQTYPSAGFDVINVDENKSPDTVIKDIETTFSGADDNDISYFYYSGHGGKFGVNKNNYLLDGLVFDGKSLDSIISFQKLFDNLNRIPGIKVVILDCCYSGEFVDLVNSKNLGNKYKVLTGCPANEEELFDDYGHNGIQYGPVTFYLTKGCLSDPDPVYGFPYRSLADTDGNGNISLEEAYYYLKCNIGNPQRFPEKDNTEIFKIIFYNKL